MFDAKKDLNPDQYQAVTFGGGPLLILAGAGSGKTRALTYRAAHLIDQGLAKPENILLLTFTNKAAAQMQQRLTHLINTTLPFAGTFHSFSAKLLRRYGHELAIPPGYLIYDDTDQLDLIKAILKDLGLSPREYHPRSVLSQIASAKNEMIAPDQYQSFARGQFQNIVADVYHRYQQRLKKAGALDFDDLLLYTVRLLETTPVLEELQDRLQFVLVDEYQDTNRAQYLIAKHIASQHRQLTAVGDASQSIYRWRGADYRNLDYLKTDFPDLITIKLEQNYRSTQIILDAATSVIQKNVSHPILSLWTHTKGGQPITLHEAADQTEEALYVLNAIRATPKATHSAILYRTNAQSRAFEEAFIRAGIPYALVGGTKFYQRKEIRDVLSYLRLIINPHDEVSRARAGKLGKSRLSALEAARADLDPVKLTTIELFDQILHITHYLDKYDEKLEEDQARIENVKELRSVAAGFDRPLDFLENVALVEDSTINNSKNRVPTETLGSRNGRIGSLREVNNVQAGSTLAQQANQNKQNNSPPDANSSNPSVTLMTIHSAKGLEFDQVFVVGLEEGLFPHSRSLLEPAELEEERRLCYVALTRAKNKLHLTYARNRLYYGGGGSGIISRFVTEIPEHLLKSSQNQSFTKQLEARPSSWAETYTIDNQDLDAFLDDQVDIDDLLRH